MRSFPVSPLTDFLYGNDGPIWYRGLVRHERSGEDKGCSCINERLLDNQDLCLLFQISPRSLQRYRSLGVLPYKRLGQKTYYTEEDVKQFIKNNVKDFNQENVEHYLTSIHQKFK